MIGRRDLHILPRVRDGLSFLYLEHTAIEQHDRAVAAVSVAGRVPIPCAALSIVLLGPGTTITHAAVRTLAASGCLVVWTGEQAERFYAAGSGETRSARNAERQARAWADPDLHLRVVRELYAIRFGENLRPELTLRQIRGMEGIRVRETYSSLSRATGVAWSGRSYRRDSWSGADSINRALSTATATLYGLVHSVVVAAGYLPSLGFIHAGKQLSFVYDVADLYKTETAFPAAFLAVADGGHDLESRVRRECRDAFQAVRLLERILPDLDRAFAAAGGPMPDPVDLERDAADGVGDLWDPESVTVPGGILHGGPG